MNYNRKVPLVKTAKRELFPKNRALIFQCLSSFHAKYQEKLMSQSQERFVTPGWTEGRTNGAFIGK